LTNSRKQPFASRSGLKLAAALDQFGVQPAGWICADLGCNVGGFVDCLLSRGASKIYAVDTGYGALEYRLRKDPRVVVMERTNAMHVQLPEPVDLVTIDVGWTRQNRILPNACRMLKPQAPIITLIKPHYEAQRRQVHHGLLPPEQARQLLENIQQQIESCGLQVEQTMESPITGQKGNLEFLALLSPQQTTKPPNAP